jgi:hypothetical protein
MPIGCTKLSSSRFLASASTTLPSLVPSLPKSLHGQGGSPPPPPQGAGSKPRRETPDPERGSHTEQAVHRQEGKTSALIAGEKRGSSHLAGAVQPPRRVVGVVAAAVGLSSPRDAWATRFLPPARAGIKDEDESASRLCDSHVATWQVSRERGFLSSSANDFFLR